MGPEKCILCGEIVPEGQQVCADCMKEYTGGIETPEEAQETAEELRDIADVLKITANTDKNIKNSMEAILRIADRLDRRKKHGKETTVSAKSGVVQITYGGEDH